jgi:eukaryotic-like serine/threonine-protein kinase
LDRKPGARDPDAVVTRDVDSHPGPEWNVDEQSDPSSLGRYEIVGRLGKGAMGVVYEAIDPSSRASVALKTITRMSPEGVYRFKREFRSLARFQHENVVSLYDLELHDGQLFYSMELVRGRDFLRWVCDEPSPDDPKTFTPCRDYERLSAALQQLVAGVEAIHRGGILHRDIKPSNILVTDEGRVVILDFGLVRQHDLDPGSSLTDDGAVLGTPLYMAPEQAVAGKVGPKSDWYGVGAVLYQALTGRAPFQGVGVLALLAAKRADLPPPPHLVAPDVPPALASLCMDLLATSADARPGAEEIARRLGAVAVPQPIAPDLTAPTLFLGRAREEAALEDAFAAPRPGAPVVVLVEGVSGMGKSALVESFLRRVSRRPDTVVLAGKCSERESIPYKALDSVMDALSDHLRHLPSNADVRALLPRDVGAVARLFPVLMSVPAIALAPRRARPDVLDATEARARGFAGLRELMGRLADSKRVVLFIDDLQWSDSDSVALLDATLRHPEAPSLIVVGTHREGSDGGHGPLARLVAALGSEGSHVDLRRVHVGPLRPDDAEALALRLLGGTSRRERTLAGQIARESEGSPFFVGELVRHARRVPLVEGDGAAEPVSLDSVIRHRIQSLPDTARRLLDVVAVAGGRLAVGIASRVAMGEEGDRSALARLRSEHLVRAHGPSETDSVEIYHDRIRETALREIGPGRLPALHLEIGRALQATGDADAVALSHHFRQAGEDQLATQHTLAAAEQAAAALAFDRAAELFRVALELRALPASDVPAIEARLGEALANTGRLHESAAAYLRASRQGEDREHLEWTRRAAEHLLASGHGQEGRAALDKVLRAVGIEPPRSNARAIASIVSSRAALGLRGLDVRLRHAADVSRDELERVDATWTAARGLLYTDGILAADFHARCLRLSLRCGDPVRIARALAFEAQMQAALGADRKHERAEQILAQAAELAERADSDYARGVVPYFAGHVAIAIGDWPRALEELERGIEILRTRCTGVSQDVAIGRAHAAICRFFLGRIREIAEGAPRLLEESLERGNPYVEGFARGLLGNVVLLAADRVEDAREQLTIYRRDAPKRYQAHMMNYVGQSAALLRYCGRAVEGWDMCKREGPALEKMPLFQAPQAMAELLFWRGSCATAAATVPSLRGEALAVARTSAARLRKHPSKFGRAYGELLHAGALGLQGDEPGAATALRAAIELLEARGMAGFAAAARSRLGVLVQGDEGASLCGDALAYYAAEGVKRPDWFVRMNAPGFVPDPEG